MSNAVMFVLAIAAFAWGLSLAAYRWIALQSAWPMGIWQAERPVLPRLIGLVALVIALVSGAVLGGGALLMVLLLGLIGAGLWIILLKVGAQSALLLAPAAAALTLAGWLLGAV
jgi:hypothetical protein